MLSNPFALTIIAIISWILTAYCAFKTRQSEGKRFVNDLNTDLGGSSFFDSLMHPVIKVMWTILWFLTFFSSLGFSAAALNSYTFADKKIVSPSEKANFPSISQPAKRESNEIVNQKIEQNSPPSKSEITVVEVDKNSGDQQNNSDQTLTEEQIKKMEKDKRYSGDDPIIRKRLGLPPKLYNQDSASGIN